MCFEAACSRSSRNASCRRLCPECARETTRADRFLGLKVGRAFEPVGCASCKGTGYGGRVVLAEILIPGRGEIGRRILDRTDVEQVEEAAAAAGMVTRWDRALDAVNKGTTSPAEVRRVLGFAGVAGESSD